MAVGILVPPMAGGWGMGAVYCGELDLGLSLKGHLCGQGHQPTYILGHSLSLVLLGLLRGA